MLNLRIGIYGALVAAGLAVAAVAMGCDDGDGDARNSDDTGDGVSAPVARPTTAAGRTPLAGGAEAPSDGVDVTLREFEIITAPFAVDAGTTTFRIQNAGPIEEHEFIILRSDLNPEKLPTADDGSVSLDDLEVVDEIEQIGVGENAELTVELAAGAYVLICNIVDAEAGATQSHYQNGMRESFRVD